MIYISYYTKGNYEEVFKKRLNLSLIKYNLFHDVKILESNLSWQEATSYKAKFCKEMLLKHKQSVVFIDVDATIEGYPLLFEMLDYFEKPDIGLHYLDWYLLWRKASRGQKKEALSGTLYFNYNQKILKFLDKWIERNKINNTFLEQKNMQAVLKQEENNLKVFKLPAEYCTIIMRGGNIPKWYTKNKPTIIHYQASRQYKV